MPPTSPVAKMFGFGPKTIAVTGANGFVGAQCVVDLLKAGFDVVAVVRDPTNPEKTQFLKDEAAKMDKAENLTFEAGDLLESGSYDKAFSEAWGVLHTAAVVDRRNENPEVVVEAAFDGTKNVIDSIKKNKKSVQRFVNLASIVTHISANEVADKVFGDDDWNTWSTVEKGDSYGYAKTKAEKLIFEDEELLESVTVVSVSPSVVIGPCFTKSQTEKGSPNIVTRCLKGFATPDMMLAYVDVRDVAKAVTLAFEKEKKTVEGQRFIINATERAMSMLEVGEIVTKVYPKAKGFTESPTAKSFLFIGLNLPFMRKIIGFTEYMAFFGMRFELDSTKSKTVLGMGDYIPFEKTCKDAAESIGALIADDDE